MKKIVSTLLVVAMCCGVIVGCGKKNFEIGKPYTLKTDDFECEVTVNSAERTDLMNDFNGSKTEEIIMLNIDIKAIKDLSGFGLKTIGSIDVWNNIRVCDEKDNEIKPFEYALPGDDTSVILIDEGSTESCTIPYAVKKDMRYLEVDMYQDTEYTNKIKVNID